MSFSPRLARSAVRTAVTTAGPTFCCPRAASVSLRARARTYASSSTGPSSSPSPSTTTRLAWLSGFGVAAALTLSGLSRDSVRLDDEKRVSPDAPSSKVNKAAEKKATPDGKPKGPDSQEDGGDGSETPAQQQSAYDPETDTINWDCPCLGGMAHGPCGEQFKAAFSCFVYSEAEPKGVDCIEKFKAMQDCFREHPDVYAEEIDDMDADEAAAEDAKSRTDDEKTKREPVTETGSAPEKEEAH